MSKITLEPHPFLVKHFCKYNGELSCDVNLDNESVVQIKDYKFVATLAFDDDFEKHEVISVEFIDETPPDVEAKIQEITEMITANYY